MKLGDVVLYIITPDDVKEINSRRTDERTVRYYRNRDRWPQGIQAHVGNPVRTGEAYPATVVRLNTKEGVLESANLQVTLDGSDCFWVQTKEFSEDGKIGTWTLPPREVPLEDEKAKTKQTKSK